MKIFMLLVVLLVAGCAVSQKATEAGLNSGVNFNVLSESKNQVQEVSEDKINNALNKCLRDRTLFAFDSLSFTGDIYKVCYHKIALQLNDPSICEKIGTDDCIERRYCYAQFAYTYQNESYCEQFSCRPSNVLFDGKTYSDEQARRFDMSSVCKCKLMMHLDWQMSRENYGLEALDEYRIDEEYDATCTNN